MSSQFKIKILTNNNIREIINIDKFTTIIYNNFINLSTSPELKHNLRDIHKLLLSIKFIGLIVFNSDNSIVGYLIGEFIHLDDGRFVFYISYMYVVNAYRMHGIGTQLLNYITKFARNNKADYIVLTTDTNDEKLYEFYMKKKFMQDIFLRTYTRYDVLSKYI